ncbi:MAG TPA: hypothetical protein VMV77_09115 [Bacteroidales bacterium]|nr:hypothetical protein [Bacteroidales bacterium]
MKKDIYKIKWHDSQSDDGWTFYKERKNVYPMIITTIGYLIYENKTMIRLAMSLGQNTNGYNQQFNGTITIPKCCIIKKRLL